MNQKEQEKLNEQLIEGTKSGDLLLVKSFFLKKIDFKIQNDLLVIAAENGHLEIVKYLVDNQVNIDEKGNLALNFSSANGHLEVVKYLVLKGADIHADNAFSLRLASEKGHLEIVKYLVKQGANIYSQEDEILRNASENGDSEMMKYLLFDCKMKVKQETKNWIMKKNYQEVLDMIEKRNLLMKLDKNLLIKDAIDNLSKKVKL